MDHIKAHQQRDAEPRLERHLLEAVDVRRRLEQQHAAATPGGHFLGGTLFFFRHLLEDEVLGDLASFLLQRHARHQRVHAGADGVVRAWAKLLVAAAAAATAVRPTKEAAELVDLQ